MTEAEWDNCTAPEKMLLFLRLAGLASDRRCRLFACACLRRVWSWLADSRGRNAVMAAERFADGRVSSEDLRLAELDAVDAWGGREGEEDLWAGVAAIQANQKDAWLAALQTARCAAAQFGNELEERQVQATVLRDLVGPLPFCPLPSFPSALIEANDRLVLKLAHAAYEERSLPSGELAAVRLAVLADALEEAGADVALLDHLRQPGQCHVRGCWVVDLLIARS